MSKMLQLLKAMALAAFALAAACGFPPVGVSGASAETVLKLWHGEPAEVTLTGRTMTSPYHGGATKFKEVVERETNGRYRIDIYPALQLFGGEREAIEALQFGVLDLVITASAPLSAWETTIGVLDLPFIFSDIQAARGVLDGPIGREIMDNLEKHGIKGLALADNTFRQLETRSKIIEEVNDLSGMKIRVMESQVFIEMFRALGANPTPLPFSEVYTGLQTGVLDGYEHPIFAFIGNRIYEVAKHVTWTNHTLTAVGYLASMKTWQELSPEDQQIFLRAAAEARDAHRGYVEEINEVAIEILAGEGVSFTEVDTSGFKARMEPVYALFEETIGKDLLDRVKNAN